MGQLTFDEEVLDWVRDALRDSHAAQREDQDAAISRHQAEYERLQARVHAMYVDKLARLFAIELDLEGRGAACHPAAAI